MKRTRSHQVSFRLNDKELIVISDYIPLLSELKRQGVNLNQLTRRINQFSPTTEQEIITTLQQCQNSYRKLIELSKKIGA